MITLLTRGKHEGEGNVDNYTGRRGNSGTEREDESQGETVESLQNGKRMKRSELREIGEDGPAYKGERILCFQGIGV